MSVQITKKPLLPNVKIEKNDGSFYTFNHFIGTYNFRLRGLTCTPARDNQKGSFEVRLTSSTATNADTNTLLNNIKRGNEVQIWIGKTDPGTSDATTRIFLGVIETLEIQEHHKSFMDVRLSGPDWGSDLLNSRIVNAHWAQEYDTDGITLLESDNSTLIKQIVYDLLTEASSYGAGDYSVEDQGLSVSITNIKTPEIKLPSFVANYERLNDKLTELDGIGGTIHYVTPDKVFHMEYPTESTSSRPAEILITDDYTNATALGWTQSKVGLIGLDSTFKSTVENKKSRFFGIGGGLEDIDQEETTNAGSTTHYNQYIAMKFRPTKIFLEGVSLYVGFTGTPPTTSLTCMVCDDDETNGQPGDVIKAAKLDQRFITAAGAWSTWKMQVELNTAKNYWIVLQKNPVDDASNHYDWYRNNGTSHTSGTSSDGETWTIDTTGYAYMFRTYYTTPLLSILSDTATAIDTSGHYHEEAIFKPDITISLVLWKLLSGEAATAFKEKEILKCRIYAPDTLLKAGQKIRVIKTSSGKSISTDGSATNDDFILGEVTYEFESNDDMATGTFWYDAELVRFVSYT